MKDLRELADEMGWDFNVAERAGEEPIKDSLILNVHTRQRTLYVLAFARDGWDCVIASAKDGLPNGAEMKMLRDLFFKPDEIVMQLYSATGAPEKSCLRLWRPHAGGIPVPPAFL